ncbi:MAG: PqqD family protein [Planctomycetota bacterium]|jgi:hypothetical protein
MDTNSRFKINVPKIVHETIDGETVILNLDKGDYYSLVGIGADIWGLIENNDTMGRIFEKISNNYQGDRGKIEVAINNFVLELKQEGIVIFNNENSQENDESSHLQDQIELNENKPVFEVPILNKYSDMQDLLLLDPIHDVDDEQGWPTIDPEKSLENN